jgi:hypothetical protein
MDFLKNIFLKIKNIIFKSNNNNSNVYIFKHASPFYSPQAATCSVDVQLPEIDLKVLGCYLIKIYKQMFNLNTPPKTKSIVSLKNIKEILIEMLIYLIILYIFIYIISKFLNGFQLIYESFKNIKNSDKK